MMWRFSCWAAFLADGGHGAVSSVSSGALEACHLGNAYAKDDAIVSLNNIQDAERCQFECGRDVKCSFFSYNAESYECWLHGHGRIPAIEDHKAAIAGPLHCDLAQAYAELAKPLVESEEERDDRIMGILHNLCKLVRFHGTGVDLVDSIRHTAAKLQDASPRDLEKMDLDDISEVITAAEEIMNDRRHMGLDEAEDQDLVLTQRDMDWIVARTTNTDELSTENHEKPQRSIYIDKDSTCRDGTGCLGKSFGHGNAWSNAKVYYCYDRQLKQSAQIALQCAMKQIRSAAPGIQFINVGYQSPGYCKRQQAIFMHNGLQGCVADIGMWGSMQVMANRRNQDLNLGLGCRTCGTAIHELLHSLGMVHEQQRPDRDRHVTVMEQNIRAGMHSQFDKKSGADTSQPYDTGSIMQYGAFAFSKAPGRLPTMVAKNSRDSKKLGQKVMMTNADKNQLRALYGCTPPSFSSCSPPAGGLPWLWIGLGALVVVLIVCAAAGSLGGSRKYADRQLVRSIQNG